MPPTTFVDIDGDGAAEFVAQSVSTSAPYAFENELQYQSFGSSAPVVTIPNPLSPSGSFVDKPGYSHLFFADWLNIARPTWLTYDSTASSNPWQVADPFGSGIGTGMLFTSSTGTGCDSEGDTTCVSGRAIDVDGDGLPDMTIVPPSSGNLGSGTTFDTVFTQRSHDGSIQPFAATRSFTNQSSLSLNSFTWRSFADMNGDGLLDIVGASETVANGPFSFWTYTNRGDGVFGSYTSTPPAGSSTINDGYAFISTGAPNPGFPALDQILVRMADVNGDGFADYVALSAKTLYVCLRYNVLLGQPSYQCISSPLPQTFTPAMDPANSVLGIADIDGSGIPHIVVIPASTLFPDGARFFDPPQAIAVAPGTSTTLAAAPSDTFPGLLKSVTLLGGATQTLKYVPVRSLYPATGVKVPVPVAKWVVSSVTKTNGISSGSFSSQARSQTTSYQYGQALYDARDQMFLGFAEVSESTPGDTGAPGLVRNTFFADPTCNTGSSTCLSVDYGQFRMMRGVPVEVEEIDSTGTHLRTTVNTYGFVEAYGAVDERVVRRMQLQQQDTYLWDPVNQQQASPQTCNFNDNTVGTSSTTCPWSSSPTVPANGTQLRKTWTYDAMGNKTAAVDFGQLGADSPIRQEWTWALSSGDTSAWSYRPVTWTLGYSQNATGASMGTAARLYNYKYTAQGSVQTITASLTNPVLFSSGPTFQAGAPPEASTSSSVCVTGCTTAGIQYDKNGNVMQIPGPMGRCTSIAYDTYFDQLPTSTNVYMGACAGAAAYTSLIVIDRGLEKPTSQSTLYAPDGITIARMWITAYDAFGRLREVDQPALAPGMTDPSAAFLATYNDTGPVRSVSYQTVDGSDIGTATYQQHESFIDGYGDTIATLDQATPVGTVPSGQTQWIVRGMHTRYTNGLARQTFQPFYADAAATSFGVDSYVTTLPSTLDTYDGLGRPVFHTDFNHNVSKRTYSCGNGNGAMVTELQDAEQYSGSHQSAHTSVATNGHGQVVTQISHLGTGPQSPADVVTTSTYLASGERSTITQSFPGTPPPPRHFDYDTLGRLVHQYEANVGDWYYAYNDAGQLVGRKDARGCGEVINHDAMGRLLSEDYSPCESTQPTYTPPGTGSSGYEAYYQYDNYNQLYTLQDRAQSSTFAYDTRARITSIQRQLAEPGNTNISSSSYAPRSYTKSYSLYSRANRPLIVSTGTALPDLQVLGASNVVSNYTVQGTLASVISSYGTLLTSQVPDASGRITQQTFGDAAATTSSHVYDNDGFLIGYTLSRPAGLLNGAWTLYTSNGTTAAGQNTFQTVLNSTAITRDMVGNPTGTMQSVSGPATLANGTSVPPVIASEWPAGAEPITARSLKYGDDYRLQSASFSYAGAAAPDDSFSASGSGYPFTAAELSADIYPTPAAVAGGHRVLNESFTNDFRGNITDWTDDATTLWDRSLGSVMYATTSTGGGTDQIASATAISSIQYDAAGNMTFVQTKSGTAYSYDYDELGRLFTAQRVDSGGTTNEAFTYNASGGRVVSALTPVSGGTTYTAKVFDSLVLKGATYTTDYEDTDATEVLFLSAGGQSFGRAFYSEQPLPSASLSNVHVFMTLMDPFGSNAFVIDHDTGEVVEAATYQPYGGVETDYRPSRWKAFRDDIRFGGHWDNAEIGLVYMNARYYSPSLGRFVSPDPATIHQVSGDLNPYEFAAGSPYRFGDATGLDPCDPDDDDCDDDTEDDSSSSSSADDGSSTDTSSGGGTSSGAGTSSGGYTTPGGEPPGASGSGETSAPEGSSMDPSTPPAAPTPPSLSATAAEEAAAGSATSGDLVGASAVASDVGSAAGAELAVEGTAGAAGIDAAGLVAGPIGAAAIPVLVGLEALGPSVPEEFEEWAPAAEGVGGVASDANLFQAYRAELAQQEIEGANAVGSALKGDPFHVAPSFVTGDIAGSGQVFTISGASGPANLTQMLGEVNAVAGRFEWIVDSSGNLTHQLFVPGGVINGVPIVP